MDSAWDAALVSFLDSIEDISGSKSSYQVYRSVLLRFDADSPRSFADATRADVQAFLHAPSKSRRNFGKPVGASAKNLRRAVLHSFYRFASLFEVDGVALFTRAAPTLGLAYLKAPQPYHGMSVEEVEQLFRAIPASTVVGLRDRALYLFYFATGRRRSEVQRLVWGDLESAMLIEPGRPPRAGHLYRYRSKGASGQVKTKELPSVAWHALHRYLEAAGRLSTMTPASPLFSATDKHGTQTERALAGITIYHRFKRYVRVSGLDSARVTLHSLRHAGARWRFEAGSDIFTIQQHLDHSSIATTALYLRRIAGMSDPAAAALEERFGHFSDV